MAGSALLIVDVQNDFCPGGALAAPGGDRIIPALNRYIAEARRRGIPIFATRDWHPAVTTHFSEYGGLWPPHCVQNTPGAAFRATLELPADAVIVNKGDRPDRQGYSAFEGHTVDGRALADELRTRGVHSLNIGGIATDYCVRHSVLDAAGEGFRITVLPDAITGIDVQPGDCDRAIADMERAGARLEPSLS